MPVLISLSDLSQKLSKIRQTQTVVLVTGCFDILHTEHLNFLQAAKAKGDILILGLESDQRVEQLKGRGRPVNKLTKRIKNLQQTNLPDYIFVLPQKFNSIVEHEHLIAQLRPHILAVSAHTLHQDEKKQLVSKYGGELRVVLPHNLSVSTSKILEYF